ncbi:tyrosine-type recombinase/integrase [Haloarchaeobius sp. DYHT-AS-18]|uniref:tyrosine-type recombinase/integrase n=1 Tax=Haloarchaeobius sp. DYHT-AS-18 TaxID=3446117 RepID=UPI003EB6FD6C
MSELEPMGVEEAIELYLEARKDDAAEWTITSHRARLRPFIEWCEEQDVDNLNDLSGRDLYHYRVWRANGNYSNSDVDKLAPTTLETSLSTLRTFLMFCADVEAVHPDLYTKVPLPELSKSDEVSDSKMAPDRVPAILDYLYRYEYASRSHVIFLLLWHCGARIGGIRAIDLEDVDLDTSSPTIEFVNRPETDTRLKNGEKSERVNRISDEVAKVIQDYIDGPRVRIRDDHGRAPLLTTTHGRISAGTVRVTLYQITRPCMLDHQCPHDENPTTCEYNTRAKASMCPSARSPHDVRKARVTKYRDDGVSRAIVSDRLDASEPILDKHYDRASERDKAERRWREINR